MTVDRSRQALGAWAERRAVQWYIDSGYEVLDRNWRCQSGELDLVVSRDDEIVFCEVKSRRSNAFGSAAEAVNIRKQRRIRKLAAEWLRTHDRHGRLRFDVAAVTGTRIEVIEAAF